MTIPNRKSIAVTYLIAQGQLILLICIQLIKGGKINHDRLLSVLFYSIQEFTSYKKPIETQNKCKTPIRIYNKDISWFICRILFAPCEKWCIICSVKHREQSTWPLQIFFSSFFCNYKFFIFNFAVVCYLFFLSFTVYYSEFLKMKVASMVTVDVPCMRLILRKFWMKVFK